MKTTLPSEIALTPGDIISWSQYEIKKARECNITYAKKTKLTFTAETIKTLAIICVSEEDLNEDADPVLWDVLEEICKDIEKSEEYMTQETTEENQTVGEAVREAFTPEVCEELGMPSLEPTEAPKEANNQELMIVTAAQEVGTSISLDDARKQLEAVFDLGQSNQVKPKPNVVVTPMDFAKAMSYGARVSSGGEWLYADAVNMLMQLGHENPVIQIASMLGRAESTVYNWGRTARRVPVELRSEAIPISTYSELANKRYDQDDEKNNEVIGELVTQAAAEKWSQDEARSHASMRQGKEPKEKKTKYRYLLISQGEPMYCIEEPVFSPGVLVIDLKAGEWLRDIENRIEYCKIPTEPTDAQLKEVV